VKRLALRRVSIVCAKYCRIILTVPHVSNCFMRTAEPPAPLKLPRMNKIQQTDLLVRIVSHLPYSFHEGIPKLLKEVLDSFDFFACLGIHMLEC
jgi:hypothetical protein